MSEASEKITLARDYFEWFLAYQEAGFTEEQAFALMCKPTVSVSSQLPPEAMEFWERNTALATRILTEMDE